MLGCIKLAVLLIFCCPVLHFFFIFIFYFLCNPCFVFCSATTETAFFFVWEKKKFLRINKHFSVSPDLQCGFLLYLLLCYL